MLFFPKIVHIFCWMLGRTFFRFCFQFEVKGEKYLKGLKGPLIIAFNHSHRLDPIFINASFPPGSRLTPIHFATWYGHYWKPVFLPFLIMAGAFPVYKGIGLEKTLKKGLEILERGGIVGIAPEERRRHLGRPRKGRGGVAFLALKTNSPVLPIYIDGVMGLKMSDVLSRKRKVATKIGKPFYLSSLSKDIQEVNLKALADLVMEHIYQPKDTPVSKHVG